MDQQNNILLTGGSGLLGSKIISSNLYPRLIVPSRNEMDITDKKSFPTVVGVRDTIHNFRSVNTPLDKNQNMSGRALKQKMTS